MSTASCGSLVDKSWGLVSLNTAILAYILCGVICTLTEIAGYWPTSELADLLQKRHSENIDTDKLYPDLEDAIFKFVEVLKMVQLYTIHIYLAAYILLPYPLITERLKVLLTPWLLCSLLRSVLLNLLMTLAGVILCSAQPTFHSPCLQYSALRGIEFCISLYLWTTVHSFFHFLDEKCPAETMEKIMKTIHRDGTDTSLMLQDSLDSMPLNSDELEDVDMEAKMVERAAMAWIAREILENGEDYVMDPQFSQYLALKATLELRQIIDDIEKGKKERRRRIKKIRTKKRVRGTSYRPVLKKEMIVVGENCEAFEQSRSLSRRDPIRKVPCLKPSLNNLETNCQETKFSKVHFLKDQLTPSSERKTNVLNDQPTISPRQRPEALNSQLATPSNVKQEIPTGNSVETQTQPLSPEMIELFDTLEKRQTRVNT